MTTSCKFGVLFLALVNYAFSLDILIFPNRLYCFDGKEMQYVNNIWDLRKFESDASCVYVHLGKAEMLHYGIYDDSKSFVKKQAHRPLH